MGFFLRALRHSSNPCNTVKKEGTNSTARQVEAMMPLKTLNPSDLSPLAPAPVARTNGNTPNPKANEVIRIGRKRERAASTAASRIGLPWTSRPSRAISTIRIPFLADSAIWYADHDTHTRYNRPAPGNSRDADYDTGAA